MKTPALTPRFTNGSVGFALQILFALLFLTALTGQALAANCTAAYTYTDSGTSTNYSLNSGQSLKVASSTYTGTINNFASGSTICVETGATFTPQNLNNAAGTLSNYGTANLQTFSYNTGTIIDNYGTLSFTAGLNTNGATTFRNRTGATMNMASSFQLGNASNFINDGLLVAQQDFNTQSGTALTNNYRMEVAGNFNPDGTVNNYGRVYAKAFMNVNANSTVTNYCTFVSYNGFNNNSPLMDNLGTILITTATGTPGGPWQNNQAFHNGSSAKIAGGNFINNSTFTGGGSMIFSGDTRNQGAFTGNSASDKINFYDETQTGSQFFDVQSPLPTNIVRTAFTRPTELDSPTTCSTNYKSFALAGTTGTITGTVYTDSNLNNTLDATETKLPNITVWLYDSAGTTLLQSIATDASGAYSFTGVAAGTYQLKVDSADVDRPAGTTIGTTNPLTGVAVAAGGTTANQNFGFDIGPYCPVAGQSVSNVSGNALTVKSSTGTISNPASALGALTAANTSTAAANSATIPNTASAQITLDLGQIIPSNASLILSLAQDTSTSKVDIQFSADNTTFTSMGTFGVSGTLGSSTVRKLAQITIPVSSSSGVRYVKFLRQASSFLIDGVSYSQICLAPGAISGTVYNDSNLNNVLDATETKLPNITVWLYDSAGTTLLQTATTDTNGAYSFASVAVGTYQVKVDTADTDLPAGYTVSTPNPLTPVAVTSGGTASNKNFGFRPPIDYGDAPDTAAGTSAGNYQTLASDGGASHIIIPNLMLGTKVDADNGLLQNASANADDTTGSSDDEDGLLPPPIISTVAGQGYTLSSYVTNTTGVTAYLTAYIDFNRDGDFTDPGEQSATQYVYWTGYFQSSFTIPSGLTTGPVYARLRLSETRSEAESPIGAASSGEVEDHLLTVSSGPYYDFGDAPASYGDARHTINSSIYLGDVPPDAEAASQPSYNASGDGFDEDGAPHQTQNTAITLFPILKMTASSYSVDIKAVNVTGSAGKLLGWIDFNQNGVFEATEAASATVANNTNGTIPLTWNNIPTDIKLGTTFIRLRLTTDSSVTTSTPTGNASNGEVEDFPIAVAQQIPPDSPSVTIIKGDTPTACSSTVFTDNFNDLPDNQYYGANTSATPYVIRNWTTTGGGGDTYARTVISGLYAATQGESIYFGNGFVRRISPDIGTAFTFDGNGKLTSPLDAIELRDNADDTTPGINGGEADWGPYPVKFSRTFATTAGQKYRLYFSAIPEDAGSAYYSSGIMRVDTPSGSIHFKAPGGLEGIQKYRIEFTAIAASSTISFVNYGHVGTDGGWCDPNSVFSGAWCSAGGSTISKNANELIIDDVTVAAASVCATSNISGVVYADKNLNNTFDAATDGTLGAISVTLYDNNGTTNTTTDDIKIASTDTAANGTYSFADVSSTLHYRIEVDTHDPDLPLSAYIGTSNPLADVTVASGSSVTNQNFGFDLACDASAGQFGGIAFRDYNQNGIRESQEEGIAGVIVTAYDSANASVATATTDVNGWYKLAGLTNGTKYRLEYTGLATGLASGAHGIDAATNTRFVTATGNCANHYGISDPVEYCQATPTVATSSYTGGNPTIAAVGNYPSIHTFPYDASGSDTTQTYTAKPKATTGQTGALWGMAYQKSTKTLYASAAMRRFAGFGTLGTGGIYKVDMTNPATNTGATAYIDVRTIGIPTGSDVRVASDSCNNLANDPALPAHDVAAWDAVGKIGIGDIDYDEANNKLWLVNLNDRKLYGIQNISPTTAPTAANVLGGYAINLPSPYTCTSGTFRPWAVKYYRGYVYVGGVCDAASDPYTVANIKGYVLKFNPANTAAGFSYVKDFALDQDRPSYAYDNATMKWNGWIPQADAVGWPYFHSPIVGNLEFDTDGSIIVGVIDRAGLQNGNNSYDDPSCTDTSVDYTSAEGDILRLCKTDTGYLSDSAPGCTTNIPANRKVQDEYYWGDMGPNPNAWESMNEVSLGGLALAPGKTQVLTSAYDAANWGSNSVVWLNNATGGNDNSYHVAWTTTGKTAGMGELEVMCDPAPIEVGNRVWLDTDKDGIQDAGEAGIANVNVTLTCGVDTATTTTDTQGEYYFSNKTGGNATFMTSGKSCTLSASNTQASLSTYSLTTQNADSKTDNNSQTDIRDSDAAISGSNAVISFTVSSTGQNNHSLDFGYKSLISAQTPFTCDANIYMARADTASSPSQLAKIDTSTTPFTLVNIGNTAHGYAFNALGYREQDNYLYAIDKGGNNLLRIDATGSVNNFGAITGLPALSGGSFYDAADVFPDGYFYVKEQGNNTAIYKINVTTSPPAVVQTVNLDKAVTLTDFAFNKVDSKIYSIGNQGDKFMIDPSSWKVTTIGSKAPTSIYGSIYTDNAGNVYAYNNSPGTLYKVDFGLNGTGTGNMTVLNSATDIVAHSDGASCRGNPPITGAGKTIGGKVFDDVNYGGGAGRALGTAGTAGVNGTRVELYNTSGAFVTSTTTDASGTYSFTGVANGSYYVRVVNATIKSTRSGSDGTELGIQTYRTDGTTAVTNEVGGRKPASADAAANTTNQTLNTTTFLLSGGGQAQSVQPLTVAGSAITGANFGFNFSTVVNTNDSGQGSLRQGITNINLLANTGLAQTGQDNTYGVDTSVIKEVLLFNIPAASDPLGRTDICGGATCKITINSQLPAVAKQPAIIDATTQPGYIAGTPGVPHIQIVPTAGLDARGFTMGYDAPDSTLRGLAITGFRNLLTNRGLTVEGERTLIESNYIGVTPAGTADGNGNGIELQYTQSAVIGGTTAAKRNIISANKSLGIFFNTGAAGGIIQNNFIGTNPAGTAAMANETSGIDTESGTGSKILDNVIAGNLGNGIELGFTSGGPGQSNAIIQGNRIGVGINGEAIGNGGPGIMNYGVSNGHTIGGTAAGQGNIIANNMTGGIRLTNNSIAGVVISGNSIYANGNLGIDLGDNGVTVNDASDVDSGANSLLNFPILSDISSASGNITIKGCAPAGATVELFEADVSAGGKATPGDNKQGKSKDYGEGQTYLASFVEGSASDTDSTTCALATDADGNNQTGMKAFSVTIPTPAGFATGDLMTATATLAGTGTSEFSPAMLLTSAKDYGDAPDSYQTKQSNNGASHTIVANFYLGATVDGETDGQPTTAADGDGTDEDGVHFNTPLLPGESALITVGTTQTNVATAYINGWIDFNHDGDFADANEHIVVDQAISNANPTLALLAAIPADALPGETYARFRLSSASGTSYSGAAADGEVEDYKVTIIAPTRVGDKVWLDTNKNGIQDAGEAGVQGVTVKLYRKSDNRLLGATLTDSTGNYFFANELAADTYYLEFTKPAGYQFTSQGAGTDPALNSDADPTTGRTGDITVAAGIPQTQWDAGLIANALVVTQCEAIPYSTTQVNHNFSLPKFDGTLGTLTGVQVNAYSSMKQIWAIENRSVSTANFRITSTMPASLTLPNATNLALDYSYNSGLFSVPAFDGVSDYAGTSAKALDAWRYETNTASNNYTPTADFVAANAGDSVTLPYSSGEGSSGYVGGGGNALFTIKTQASAGVCINYTYTPPPPPPIGCSVLDNFDSTSVATIDLTTSNPGPITQTWNANVDALIGGSRTVTFGSAPKATATNGYGLLDIADNASSAAPMKLCYNANGAGLNLNLSQTDNILFNVWEDAHHNPDPATRSNIPMSITLSDGFNSASLTQDMVNLVYQQLGITDGWANIRFPLANFTGINTISRTNIQSICIEVAGDKGHDYSFEKVVLEDTATCSTVSGKVFEDVNYGGNAGNSFSSAVNAKGINGTTLELYDNSGHLIESTDSYPDASNGAGTYTFAALTAGDYYVRAVNNTVKSTRSGADGSELGVMTYRTNGVTPTATEIGGRNPTASDATVHDREAILNTTTFKFSGGTLNNQQAQVVQPITLAATNLSNVSFGFNFDTVTNANDSGAGSLRQFILNANLLGGDSTLTQTGRTAGKENAILALKNTDPNYVTAGTYWSIPLQSALPSITSPLILDGSTPAGSNSKPMLELKGTTAGAGTNGLTLNGSAGGSTIRKLAINRFGGAGIYLNGSNANILQANHIGTDPAGTTARANTGAGILLNAASNNLIGGIANATSNPGNLLANNGGDGIAITGTTALANTILGNSIYSNTGLGIDLGDDGVTANDVKDTDAGANDLLNYPAVKTNSFGANGTKVITYDFDLDVPAGDYRLEFFASVAKNPSGNGEGQTFIGSKDISHTGTGSQNYKGTFNATMTVLKGTFISTTLTQKTGATTFGATSEFSGIRDGIATQVCDSLTAGTGSDMVIDESNATTVIKLLEAWDYSTTPKTRITYVISGGADGNLFTVENPTANATLPCAKIKFITNDVVIAKSASVAPTADTRAIATPGYVPPPGNYELPMDVGKDNVYNFQVTATTESGQKYVRDLSVRVMDTNEAPTITSAAAVSFNEDTTANVLDIASQDPDAGTAEGKGLTYTISGGADANLFEVDPATGILRFRAIPDYDAPTDTNRDNLYEVEVTVTDNGGLSGSKLFKVSVVNNTADDGVLLNVKALLQGAYDSKTGLMSADLNTLGLLPTKQPYKAAPFNYAGTETLSTMLQEVTGNNAVVDWILVDLRSSPTSVVASRAVMLQRNGDLVDAQTGSADLHFANVKAGNYYVSVRHRNHLGVISASPISLNYTPKLVNFAASSTAVKGEEARLVSGKLAMLWAGDINGSNTLTANGPGNDVTSLLSGVITSMDNVQGNTNHILSGYLATDLNMDGKTLFTGPGNDTSLLVGNIILHPLNTGFAANYIVKGGLQ